MIHFCGNLIFSNFSTNPLNGMVFVKFRWFTRLCHDSLSLSKTELESSSPQSKIQLYQACLEGVGSSQRATLLVATFTSALFSSLP